MRVQRVLVMCLKGRGRGSVTPQVSALQCACGIPNMRHIGCMPCLLFTPNYHSHLCLMHTHWLQKSLNMPNLPTLAMFSTLPLQCPLHFPCDEPACVGCPGSQGVHSRPVHYHTVRLNRLFLICKFHFNGYSPVSMSILPRLVLTRTQIPVV